MQQAMALPSVKRKNAVPTNDKKFKVIAFSEKDRCSIFLLYAKVLMKNKKTKESKNVMNLAISQFAGTN
jgi:tetratricopeptide repeat protein 21B